MWEFDYEHNYIKVAHWLRKWLPVLSIWYTVIEFCLLFIILPIENCITMTRNALSLEAVGRILLRHLIKCLIKDWQKKILKNYKHVELEGRHLLGFKAGCRGEGKRWALVTNILAGGQC